MGSHIFRWPHPASEVYVTGTFDNWAKTVKMTKVGEAFEKNVQLTDIDSKIYFKFVSDGNWTTDHTAPQETDHQGNVNNVLLPEEIKKHGATAPSMPAVMGGAAAVAATAATAATAVAATATPPPHSTLHAPGSEDVPGGFPESPAGEQQKQLGGGPESAYGVSPIPATGGAGNPINLQPGEAVPHHSTITDKSVDSHVTTDKAAYEAGGTTGVGSSSAASGIGGLGAFALPPIGSNMIPESSLPMGAAAGGMDTEPGVHIQSAHPSSTTADLAGAQPIIPRSERQVTSIHPSSDTDVAPGVPEVVKESQHAAGQGPEAAGSAEAVAEKSMVEKELTQHVTPAAVTSDEKVHESKPSGVAGMLGMGAAGAGIGGAVAAGVAALTGSKSPQTGSSKEPEQAASTKPMSSVPEPKSSVPEPMSSVPEPVSSVPEPVKESMHEAHASPEAASSAEAVAEKAKVEEELTRRVTPAAVTSDEKVHESKPSGVAGMLGMGAAGAGIGGAVAAGVAALTGSKSQPTGSAKEPSKMASTEPVSSVPEAVKESMHEAHASPEAAANPVAVKEKKAVESELLSEIPREQSTGASAPSMAAVSSKSTPTAADVLTSTEKSTTMGSPKSELGTSQSSGGVGALFTPSVPSKDGYLGSDYAKKDVTAPVKTTDTPMFSNTAPIAPSTALPVAATSAGNSGATAAAASSGLAGTVSSQAMASQFTAGPESVTKQATTMGDDAINQTTAALPSRGKGAAAAPIDTEKAAPSTPTAARSGLLSPMNNSSNLATPASPALSETPSSSLGGESSTAKADRKSKRHSIFNRIKDKLSHH